MLYRAQVGLLNGRAQELYENVPQRWAQLRTKIALIKQKLRPRLQEQGDAIRRDLSLFNDRIVALYNECLRSELFAFDCPTDLFPALLDNLSKRLALLEGESHDLVQLQLLLTGSETPSDLQQHAEARIVRFEYLHELREKLEMVQRLSTVKNAIIKKHALWLKERWSRLDVVLVRTRTHCNLFTFHEYAIKPYLISDV